MIVIGSIVIGVTVTALLVGGIMATIECGCEDFDFEDKDNSA